MKERPIIMNAKSVQAILDGRKTQTRRVVKFNIIQNAYEPTLYGFNGSIKVITKKGKRYNEKGFITTDKLGIIRRCPYGKKGDRLWVKENLEKEQYGAISYAYNNELIPETSWVWKKDKLSAMFMPRGLSRITLEITNIRVERLQDMTAGDAIAEGMPKVSFNDLDCDSESPADVYKSLWDKLNAKRSYSWDSNPFVWVIEFKRVQ